MRAELTDNSLGRADNNFYETKGDVIFLLSYQQLHVSSVTMCSLLCHEIVLL